VENEAVQQQPAAVESPDLLFVSLKNGWPFFFFLFWFINCLGNLDGGALEEFRPARLFTCNFVRG